MNARVTSTGSTPAGLFAPVALAAAAGELASSTPSCSGPVFACDAGGSVAPGPLPPAGVVPGLVTVPGTVDPVPGTLPGAPGTPGVVPGGSAPADGVTVGTPS